MATKSVAGMPYSYGVTYEGDSNVVNLTDSLLGTWTCTPDALDRSRAVKRKGNEL